MAAVPPLKRVLLRTISVLVNAITFPLSLAVWALAYVFRNLPERGAYRLSAVVTPVLFSPFFWVRRANLRKFFEPLGWTKSEIRALHRRHKQFLALWMIDVARLLDATPEVLQEKLIFEGEEHLTSAVARGKGVLLLNAHLGNWWYGRACLWLRGHLVVGVSNRVEILSVEQFQNKLRRRFRSGSLHVASGGTKAAAELFGQNGIFSVYFDVAMPRRWKHSRWARFGTVMLHADLGPERLALNHDAAVLFISAVRTEGGVYRVTIAPMPASANRGPEELQTLWLEELHRRMLQHPEQWWNWGAVWLRKGDG